jgi:hypothetical protein
MVGEHKMTGRVPRRAVAYRAFMKISKLNPILLYLVTLLAAPFAHAQLTWDANGTGAGQTNGTGDWPGSHLFSRVLDLTANGGINPSTGNPWQAGDNYRLVFATSTTTTAASTSIATCNTLVQNAANKSTTFPNPDTVSWKAICSTGSVNANTGTVTGAGEAIFLMNGSTVTATVTGTSAAKLFVDVKVTQN